MLREAITTSPLYWPSHKPRTTIHQRSQFRNASVYFETQEVLAELARMGIRSSLVKVSTNQRLRKDGQPIGKQRMVSDPGVAVWFQFEEREQVMACDKWDRLEHNMRAVFLHIEALRGQERWGVATLEESFRGFVALPETVGRPWREVLGFGPHDVVTVEGIRQKYRIAAKDSHPDMKTGSAQRWDELQGAVTMAKRAIHV